MKKIYSLLIISLFCSGFLLMYFSPVQAEKPLNEILFEKISPSAYISHDPINITSDGDFSSYSFAGDGSFQNPYLIEGLSIINSTSPFGILINNTASHFIVRNCYLETNAFGLVVENVANNTAIVMDNIAFGNNAGAFVLRSTHYAIVSNNVAELDRVGINITNCFGVYVGNNTLTGGIPAGYSCHSGILTTNCENIVILNNSISNFNNGFYSKKSSEMFLENNTILYSIEDYGIYLTEESNYNHIINNTICYSTTLDGIHLSESSDNEIAFNTLINNTDYGCNLQIDSLDNVIHHNNFLNNNHNSTQGFAASIDNSWYDTSLNEGNYWSNWNNTGVYNLIGVGEDPYPLNTTQFANWTILSSPVPNIDDPFEDNDRPSVASPIVSNTLYSNLIANDRDFYSLNLTREDRISIEINFNDDLGNLELYFFGDYFQSFINSTSSTGTVNLVCDCTRSGVYYIAVLRNQSSVPFLIYSLTTSLTTQIITDDIYEDNDHFWEGKPVAKNISHDLVYKDLDYFLFTIPYYSTIEVTVSFDSQLIDLDIYLLPDYFNGSMWQVLAFSERSTSPESFIYESEYTGTHTLLVKVFGDSFTPQSYTLFISTDVTTDQIIIQSLFLTLISLITLVSFSVRFRNNLNKKS
ncbi:MAG: right-handed parallel beta-helix repeat-containing protein [Candidatus Heimdallarchaeota archaeon]